MTDLQPLSFHDEAMEIHEEYVNNLELPNDDAISEAKQLLEQAEVDRLLTAIGYQFRFRC